MARACYDVVVSQRPGHRRGSKVCCALGWRAGAEAGAERWVALTHRENGLKGTKHDLWTSDFPHGSCLQTNDHLPVHYLASGGDAWPAHEVGGTHVLGGSAGACQDLGAQQTYSWLKHHVADDFVQQRCSQSDKGCLEQVSVLQGLAQQAWLVSTEVTTCD